MTDLAMLLPLPVMFFALGLGAGLLRSDLAVPEAVAKGLSLYLMMAIGLKGGLAIAAPGAATGLLPALAVGVGLSFLLPLPAFGLLRLLTPLDRDTAAAVAGHYGSVSVVTFAAAVGVLNQAGVTYESFMPAILATMETPAILSALLLARTGGAPKPSRAPRSHLAREVLLNGSVVLLMGSFAIGWIAGPPAYPQLAPFIEGLWTGALCLFLLEMGLLAARQLRAAPGKLGARLVGFGLLMPLIGAGAGLGGAALIGLSTGGIALMAVLGGSASYIAVPAAMRMALPRADPGVYVPLSIAISFPFNVILGIPLYLYAARLVGG